MPRANIYISEEDWGKWLALNNKSQFVHDALVSKLSIKDVEDAVKKIAALPKGKDEDRTVWVPNPTNTPASKSFCKEHGVDKSVCRLMKHKK